MEEVYEHCQWKFVSCSKDKPARTAEVDAIEESFDLNPGEHLPELLWLNNFLRISNADIEIAFSTPSFLNGTLKETLPCDSTQDPLHTFCLCPLRPEADNLSLPFASHWREASSSNTAKSAEVIQCKKSWVHLSGYKGEVRPIRPNVRIKVSEQSENQLPLDLLRDTSLAIEHFCEIPLVEDDLADCGVMTGTVKLRVMSTFFFLALIQLVRIDGSIQRQRTTKVFHKFGTQELLRETVVTDEEHIINDVSKQDEAEGHRLGKQTLHCRKLEVLTWH
eukprot:Protomagalhaensia_sp_Gyna_25__5492@NODE_72_length_5603_cov_36_969267_g54_i0_p3_GENE_NODE_72_length_5603_cov_36_969267_g54_i0NODE_72_length_5603_cov_36_969267_g54_i0_p3_ORF_typecomplete_len277_score34_80TIP41/PF04176_13/9_1e27_NODE_72_length_5603_cov_36_969267_g54_i029543784